MALAPTWVSLSPTRPAAPGPWVAAAVRWLSPAPDAAAAPASWSQSAPDAAAAPAGADPVASALAFALELGADRPFPGTGRTAELWELLATVAAADLAAARTLEPHLDALAILDQAAHPAALPTAPFDATWGVFAAEGGDDPLTATRDPDGSWTLTGTKPWCSLADRLDRALISATLASAPTPAGTLPASSSPDAAPTRALFAVDLRRPGVTVAPGAWHARGLAEVPSGPVHFSTVPAEPVGDPGWYLSRPGFSWGGISVAACWFGGTVGLARTLFARARAGADPLLHMHLGAVDVHISDARRALAEAAALVDAGAATGDPGRLLAKRVRATVAAASEAVLGHVAHALGPAPLALDPEHSKRVADLELYIRQHHAEKDDLSLGRQLAAPPPADSAPAAPHMPTARGITPASTPRATAFIATPAADSSSEVPPPADSPPAATPPAGAIAPW